MIRMIKPVQPGRIILAWSFLFLFLSQVVNAQESRQLSRDELYAELRNAVLKNDEIRAAELIKKHRLLIKPIVGTIITETITNELKGKTVESNQLSLIGEKTAEIFYRIFNEKSLLIAVNYLTEWSIDQKKMKLVADSLYSAGLILRDNEPEKAIDYYLKALSTYRKIEDERGEAEVLGGLGQVNWDRDNQASLSYYEEALKKRVKVDDKQLIGNTLNSIGLFYYTFTNEFSQAVDNFEKAVLIRTEIGDQVSLNRTLSNKAEAFLKKGEQMNDLGAYPEALEYLEKALQIHSNLKNKIRKGVVLNQIGLVCANVGDLPTSLERLNEAEEIMKEEKDTLELAGVYNHIGIVLQSASRFEKSLEYYNNALELYEKQEALTSILPILSNIGTIYFDINDYVKAEDYHYKALTISREIKAKDEEVRCLLNLANDQNRMGKMDDSKSNYNKGLEIALDLNNADLIWRIIIGMAEYYEKKGDIDKALELNDSALKILDGIRGTLRREEWKTSYMAQERYVFEYVIDLLGKLHRTDPAKGYDIQAFGYAERSKSRSFLDLLNESSDLVYTGTGNGNNGKKYTETVSIDDAKALCPDKNTVILQYSVGDSSSSLWAITRSDHMLYKLPDLAKIKEVIETIRFALLDPQESISEYFTKAGVWLYDELIKPAEPFLSRKSRLIIITDGVLNYLPFEVLLTGSKKLSAKDSYSDIPFLIKKYPISYVQSASVLKILIAQKNQAMKYEVKTKRLLAFGDPLYEDSLFNPQVKKYPRLLFSDREIENIAGFFPQESYEIYLRNKATEEDLKNNNNLNKFKYIHLATHGFINENKPDLSSLVLTSKKNSGEDGFLKAEEIYNMKMNPDLVVLSACQTGLGKLIRGEGMVGLTRAFMYAGAPSVIVSLWSVSDMSTAELMKEFYKNLIKNKQSKIDALRKAQLTLINDEKHAHPFYWAPFVLIGDWR